MSAKQSRRDVNDQFRRSMTEGKVVLQGALAVRPDLTQILEKVRICEHQNASDPFGNGSFGVVEHAGDWFCWEIAEELSLEEVSFSRVIKIMLASDY